MWSDAIFTNIPHFTSLFSISKGVFSFVYCWLFFLGTLNYIFPTLLLGDFHSLRFVIQVIQKASSKFQEACDCDKRSI